ncbi:MAG: UDP-N-acetylmuramoyl-tripeptide--D-alanyl-D-alanine ligase [Candidatus Pacebacteria bacterium]|nr:UDP-N-acetylmuramoyl-tripeptide--D-alanyl-D-alanine ligase [Candidatus Paceibacterota bacterium]
MVAFLRSVVVYILTLEARAVLLRHKPSIVAVTGSVGKTTTKDAIYAALSGELHVRKSAKSFNSEFGVPLTILGLETGWNDPWKWLSNMVQGFFVIFARTYPKWLVLEVGADRPGDIRRIAVWLRPDISVITGVPDIPVHVEYFNSPGEVLKEKRELADHLKPGGTLILNGDEARMRMLQNSFRGTSLTYGFDQQNSYAAFGEEILYENDMPNGMQFKIMRKGETVPMIVHHALGRPRVYAATAALAVAEVIGIDTDVAAAAISKWDPPPGRVRVLPGIKGTVIIDDTYNSSPTAVLAALDTLKMVKGKRKIAVLGDMLELGRYSSEAHKHVGERVAETADMLRTVGFRSRLVAESALDAGMKDAKIMQYEMDEAERAGKELERDLKPGDVVLVKGSQSMRMERTVLEIMAEPMRADELLVRMDSEWKER